MIMFIFRITIKLFVKCISLLIGNSRKNRRKILSKKNFSNLLALTANIRKNYANLHNLHNCVEKKCKKIHFCVEPEVEPELTSSSNKIKIPKVKEPHVDAYGKINAPNLVTLLQAIGFQLQQFEISKETNSVPAVGSIQVTIQCGSSRMKAVLEIEGIECQCPSTTEAAEGSLWTSCGTDPSHDDKAMYVESGTNLLPEMPKGVNTVVRDVVYRLLKILNTPEKTERSPGLFNLSTLNIEEITGSSNAENKDTLDRVLGSYIQPPTQPLNELPIQPSIQPNIQSARAPIQSARALSFNEQILFSENPFPPSSSAKDEKTPKVLGDTKFTESQEEVLPGETPWYSDADSVSEPRIHSPFIGSQSSSDNKELLSRRYSLPEQLVYSAYKKLELAVNLLSGQNPATSSTMSLHADFFDNPPPPSDPRTSGASPILRGPLPRSSTFTSEKAFPVKPPTRRSVPPPIPKTSEKPTTSVGERTPMRRKSALANIPILPTKPNPQHRLSVPRTTLTSSMNSLNLSDKRRVSPSTITRSTLMPKRRTCPDVSFGGPSTSTSRLSRSTLWPSTLRSSTSRLGPSATSTLRASTSVPGPSTSAPGPSTSTSGPSTSTSGPSTSTPGPSTSMPGPSTSTLGPSRFTLPNIETTSKGTPGKAKFGFTKSKKGSKEI